MGKTQRTKLQAVFDKGVSQSLTETNSSRYVKLLTLQMIDCWVQVSELTLFIKLPVDWFPGLFFMKQMTSWKQISNLRPGGTRTTQNGIKWCRNFYCSYLFGIVSCDNVPSSGYMRCDSSFQSQPKEAYINTLLHLCKKLG